jgi:hypothetical protein
VRNKTAVRIADRRPISTPDSFSATDIRPATFSSILHQGAPGEMPEPPGFFADLNLDQIVDAITAGKDEYSLKPFFYAPLKTVDAISYRHEIFRDLETGELLEKLEFFAKKMRTMREHLAQANKLGYRYQKESWFLDAAEIYCVAVSALAQHLSIAELNSRGFSSTGCSPISRRKKTSRISTESWKMNW